MTPSHRIFTTFTLSFTLTLGLGLLAVSLAGCPEDGSEAGDDVGDTGLDDTGDDVDDTGLGDTGDDTGLDTGPDAEARALEVHADGERIGYLVSMDNYTLTIWDDVNDLLFTINDTNGILQSEPPDDLYYKNDSCGAFFHLYVRERADNNCLSTPTPVRRPVWGWGGDLFNAPNSVWTTKPKPENPILITAESVGDGVDECTALDGPTSICVFDLETTNLVPAVFPLPIEIVDAGG